MTSPTAVVTTALDAGGRWTQLRAGYEVTCGIRGTGALWCWGSNGHGEVGDDASTNRLVPTREFTGATTRRSVGPGAEGVCATRTDDSPWCWGAGAEGELGDGTTTAEVHAPQQAPGLRAASVAMNRSATDFGSVFAVAP